jgi:hypothetical protein
MWNRKRFFAVPVQTSEKFRFRFQLRNRIQTIFSTVNCTKSCLFNYGTRMCSSSGSTKAKSFGFCGSGSTTLVIRLFLRGLSTYNLLLRSLTEMHYFMAEGTPFIDIAFRLTKSATGCLLVLLCRCTIFNLRYEYFDLSPGLGVPLSIQSHSTLCIATQTTDCYWLYFLSTVNFSNI